jgi:hypothetical protein
MLPDSAFEKECVVTDPDMATVLRNMKVPERMAGSQALRAYLLSRIEQGEDAPDSPDEVKRLNALLLLSHLEVINALGALEERIAVGQYNNFQAELDKSRKRKRWL